MEIFSTLLAINAGNSPVTGEFPTQRPVTWSFHVFFDLWLNKRLSKQSWGQWFEMPSCSLWPHCNDVRSFESYPYLKCSTIEMLWRHISNMNMFIKSCLDILELEQLERLRSEDTPRRLMITHTIESCWVPNQNKVEWPWRYRSRSKVITCDPPSHAGDHLCQIWKESTRNCRCYRADTIFKAKAKWPWRYRSRSKVIICNTHPYTSDHLC